MTKHLDVYITKNIKDWDKVKTYNDWMAILLTIIKVPLRPP